LPLSNCRYVSFQFHPSGQVDLQVLAPRPPSGTGTTHFESPPLPPTYPHCVCAGMPAARLTPVMWLTSSCCQPPPPTGWHGHHPLCITPLPPFHIPPLRVRRYASFQVHPSGVVDLQLLGDCAITVSGSKAAVTTAGGFTRAAVTLDPAVSDPQGERG
jgi:hypothetical protein